MPAVTRRLQQSNLESAMNALTNAATRLERFHMIYEKRYPDMAEFARQIEDKIKGAFIETMALRESI